MAEVLMVVVAIVAFVVIIASKVPEWIAPEGGPVASNLSKSARTGR
jgi:hypothetical protein